MKGLTSAEAILRTSGVALLIALVSSVVILDFSPSDSAQRGFGHGAVNAVCWLYLFWTAIVLVAIAMRRRFVTKGFWFVFAVNTLVSTMVLAEFWSHR